MAQKQLIYKGNTFNISYEILNHNLDADVVILHGWGSSKALMKSAFGSYLKGFRHIYI